MTAPVETTAAMTLPAEQHDPADVAAGSPVSGPDAGDSSVAAVDALDDGGARSTGRREMSPNVVIALFGGLVTTLLGALFGMMMWQFNSLGARIDAHGLRIDSLDARIDAQGESLGARIDAQGESLGARIDAQGESLGARIDAQGESLGARIDAQGESLGARIDSLATDLRAEMLQMETNLRFEMQAGFAEITAVLLDHTDRLARLETAAGLPRPGG